MEKYIDLIMSMSLSFKMGDITKETYLTNLKMMVGQMEDL